MPTKNERNETVTTPSAPPEEEEAKMLQEEAKMLQEPVEGSSGMEKVETGGENRNLELASTKWGEKGNWIHELRVYKNHRNRAMDTKLKGYCTQLTETEKKLDTAC